MIYNTRDYRLMSDVGFTKYFKQRLRNGNRLVNIYGQFPLNCKDLVEDVLAFQFLSTGKHSDLNMLIRSCRMAEQELAGKKDGKDN